MSQVALWGCTDYQQQRVDQAVAHSLELLGGVDQYIKPGMKVLLKCNLLMKKKPEEAATTHPSVVEALVKLIQATGATPIIGDSPAGLYTQMALRGVYRACGMEAAAEKTGAVLNYNTNTAEVRHPDGRILKGLSVIEVLNEVDAVISVCKLKTHGMTLFTGAVKNLFGVIPGMTKAEYHLRMRKLDDFSNMILDICTYVKPVLSVMDAVVGMEGHGPSAGDPRKVGVILVSDSPYALDVAAASLVGIPPRDVPTIRLAEERGLQSSRLKDIELLGDSFSQYRIKDFKIPKAGKVNFFERYFSDKSRLAKLLNDRLGPRPEFIPEICIGCRDCEKLCPPKAISMVDGKPRVNLEECIRCYCCQELCPQKAVKIKRSLFFKTIK